MKDSHKIDVFNFDIEKQGELINLTINNVISWEWQKLNLTKSEFQGLARFLTNFAEKTKEV